MRLWALPWLLVGLCITSFAHAQPDVVVSNTGAIKRWGMVGNITGYSISSTSCNIGSEAAIWIANTNEHPLIGQNLYRVDADGQLVQIGMSWLKHSFCAVNETTCGVCQVTPCETLGIGCADTYNTNLNGDQANLGPRSDVDPSTGVFTYPFPTNGMTGDAIYKRVQVHNSDLDPALNPDALYFGVVQYITTDEAAAGTQFNNNSYRLAEVGAFDPVDGWELSYTSDNTVVNATPIDAWMALASGVEKDVISTPEAAGGGQLVVGTRVVDLGGGMYRYQYAIFNDNSHRGARSFSIPVGITGTVSNLQFHDVDYHSGEVYDGTDWTGSVANGAVTFSTEEFANNEQANALRWGTTYSFSFDVDLAPQLGTGTIGLFRPGGASSVSLTTQIPADPPPLAITFPLGIPDVVSHAGGIVQIDITEQNGGILDLASPTLHYDAGNGFQTVPVTQIGGTLFEAQFPAIPCGTLVAFYVSASDTRAIEVTAPELAPDMVFGTTMGIEIITDVDDMETDRGWIVGASDDDATTGIWERVDPNGTDAQPEDDQSDPGTLCWITGQHPGGGIGANDVDGGKTTLISPRLSLSGTVSPRISYYRWFSNDLGASPNSDVFTVDISGNNGSSWTNVEIVGPEGIETDGGWYFFEFDVSDFINPTDNVRVRFVATDEGQGSIIEAGVDDFTVSEINCDAGLEFIRGDCNQDSVQDVSDPIHLLDGLFGTGSLGCLDACDADDDGSAGIADAIFLLNHRFQGGMAPRQPYPGCGADPTGNDGLSCDASIACP